ncbi:MAG: UDP-N-acetylmuramate dehydrogenase [candidate division Zixibacteria bacterium]|nr:UDP-N-acetylmuramate dehydrogenase [candidate division Zixibacteria bacterium]
MTEQLSVSNDLTLQTVQAAFGHSLEWNKELAPLTSYKTGGRAKYFITAVSAVEIAKAISAAKKLKLNFFLIGGGSNLLISDEGFDGLIIKVDVRGLTRIEPNGIECGAGEDLMALVDFATNQNLTGAEFAAGIWGSVGGAVYGNAGAFGGEIGQITTEVTLVDIEGRLKVVAPDYCRFSYRDSFLKVSHEVVVSVKLALQPGNSSEIQQKVDDILKLRETKHPNAGKSAGCFFKNIPDPREQYGKLPAGRLLEEVGAKGLSVGGAKVFEKHANIIVNTGTATSRDIRSLADIMKKRVFEKFGIMLNEEVQTIGKF